MKFDWQAVPTWIMGIGLTVLWVVPSRWISPRLIALWLFFVSTAALADLPHDAQWWGVVACALLSGGSGVYLALWLYWLWGKRRRASQ